MYELTREEKNYFIDKVTPSIKRINFLKIFSLLESLYLKKKIKDIQIKFNATFASVAGDFEKIEFLEKEKIVVVTLNFYALFGAHGLLPDYLLEKSFFSKNFSLIEFLNLFYQRIIEIIYSNKKQIYPILNLSKYGFINNSMMFSGNNLIENINFNSIFLNDIRNVKGLEIIIKSIFKIDVKIEEFQGEFINISDNLHSFIGHNNILGKNAILGTKFWDQISSLNVVLKPKSIEEVEILNPNKILIYEIIKVIKNYLNAQFNFKIVIEPISIYPVFLSNKNNSVNLGWNSFISSKEIKNNSQRFYMNTIEDK